MYDNEFEQFIATYGKNYASESELEYRRSVFQANMVLAEELNELNPEAEFGVTMFADQTQEEMNKRMGYLPSDESDIDLEDFDESDEDDIDFEDFDESYEVDEETAPKDLPVIDWQHRMHGVRNQGDCGSCWAFSAIATMEGRLGAKHKRKSAKYSEQQLLDCVSKKFDCKEGGIVYNAWVYLQRHTPFQSKDYRYKGKKGTCKTKKTTRIKIKGRKKVPQREFSIHHALKRGPLSIGVDARSWHLYKRGVMTHCRGRKNGHAVVLVSYQQANEAWVIRNSWGGSWGERGHIRLKYGINACNIKSEAQYPIVA